MNYCSNCGKHLPEEAIFCPVCGTRVVIASERDNNWDGQAYDTEGNVENSKINNDGKIDISENIYKASLPVLSEDEVIVKHYHCASVKLPNSDGFLTVTNKRVIFHASDPGEISRICFEVLLDSVSGISCLIGQNIKAGRLVFAILITLFSFSLFKDSTFLGIILILLGFILAISACKATYSLKIYSSKANGSPINLGEGATSFVGNSSIYSISCKPTPETKVMIKELGAIIIDLQTLGDHAIEKWNK